MILLWGAYKFLSQIEWRVLQIYQIHWMRLHNQLANNNPLARKCPGYLCQQNIWESMIIDFILNSFISVELIISAIPNHSEMLMQWRGPNQVVQFDRFHTTARLQIRNGDIFHGYQSSLIGLKRNINVFWFLPDWFASQKWWSLVTPY